MSAPQKSGQDLEVRPEPSQSSISPTATRNLPKKPELPSCDFLLWCGNKSRPNWISIKAEFILDSPIVPMSLFIGDSIMQRFFGLLFAMSIATAFLAGCEKKAEVKSQTTVTSPEGTTTTTDSHKVETDKK